MKERLRALNEPVSEGEEDGEDGEEDSARGEDDID